VKFGTYHTYQVPPWTTTEAVFSDELERVKLAEDLGFDSVWVPEQHFFDYCASPDALDMVAYLLGQTSRVRVGAAVVNLSLTHPLRFAERATLLDRLGQGRVDLCVGRGYQWPQNVAFGVDEGTTKPRFTEALDIVLASWDGSSHDYEGRFFSFPPVRVWPGAVRPPSDVLLMSVGGTTPLEETIARGLPLALSSPFAPLVSTATTFARYVDLLEASHHDTDAFLDRAIVLLYALLAPSKDEARTIARQPFAWHTARLGALSTPPGADHDWAVLTAPVESAEIPDGDYDRLCEHNLLFEDPQGFSEKIDLLQQAGVRNIVTWMGVGGVSQEHVLRSMRLFADEVQPRFTR
jgi:alkanesulfonate monooxygenase SsuD/methylene tetrahydromethanopterin reductase-like flavin-dependent oxidoreductase (luciferase family)